MPPLRMTCKGCKSEFIITAARLRKGEGVYCSRACFAEAHPTPLSDRFWSHVRKGEGCWQWDSPRANSYPRIRRGGGGTPKVSAHRLAWELTHGDIPPGMFVCHHCDNKNCVRPDHLFLGKPIDNSQDMIRKGRHKEQRKPKPTHCNAGHAYTLENIRVENNGRRRCRQCLASAMHKWQARNREYVREYAKKWRASR